MSYEKIRVGDRVTNNPNCDFKPKYFEKEKTSINSKKKRKLGTKIQFIYEYTIWQNCNRCTLYSFGQDKGISIMTQVITWMHQNLSVYFYFC